MVLRKDNKKNQKPRNERRGGRKRKGRKGLNAKPQPYIRRVGTRVINTLLNQIVENKGRNL